MPAAATFPESTDSAVTPAYEVAAVRLSVQHDVRQVQAAHHADPGVPCEAQECGGHSNSTAGYVTSSIHSLQMLALNSTRSALQNAPNATSRRMRACLRARWGCCTMVLAQLWAALGALLQLAPSS